MPYIKELDMLFIHIPKTGGTSFEEYLLNKKKYTLYLHSMGGENKDVTFNHKSLQHMPYKSIIENQQLFNIKVKIEDVKMILAFVRNPYERVMSDLFWLKFNNKDDSPEDIYNTLQNYYFDRDDLDYHNYPQHYFLLDSDGKRIENVKIIKTEDLTNSLQNIGFFDYNVTLNDGKSKSYMKYLNEDSIRLINSRFKKDFELFEYPMK
jgi:hypothetical protein